MTDKITLTFTIDEYHLNPVSYDQLGQYTIDWGDGTEEAQTYSEYGDHEYSEPGTYTIVFDFGEGRYMDMIHDSYLSCSVPYDISFLIENSYTIYSLPSNVRTIKFETSTVPIVEDGGLDNLENLTTIYVPSGSLSSFTSATNFPSTSDVEYVEFSLPATKSPLYNNIKTLTKQWVYDKDEMNTLLADKLESSDISDVIRESETAGLIKNDGTVDTSEYLTSSDLSDYVTKSETTGLIKNDGTIDTSTYLTQHQSLDNYIEKSQTTGLVKNDGTIDTNTYLTSHQSLADYIQKSQTTGLVKNDGTIDTNTYLTSHQSLSDIGGEVDVQVKSTANTNAFKTYEITQNNIVVGEIDIPKDFLVKSGSVKTVGSTPSSAETGAGLDTGDLYISLIINSKDSSSSSGNEELIIPANGLVEDTTYDADNSTIQLNGTTFSIKSGGVTVTQLANDAVETAKIKDENVTYAKLSSTCIASIKADADSEINAALDALAEAIYPSSS